MRTTNRWGSRYGDRYISLPSTISELGLDYELLEVR